MFKLKFSTAKSFATCVLATLLAQAPLVHVASAAPASLEELLEQTRSARAK